VEINLSGVNALVPERIGIWYGEETWNFTKINSDAPAENGYTFIKSTDGKKEDSREPWRYIREGKCEVIIGQPHERLVYFFRLPAIGDGSLRNPYTPASKIFRVRPLSLSREPRYKISRNNTITMKMGDMFIVGDGEAQPYTGMQLDVNRISSGTKIVIWRASTGRRPASLKQEIIVP
jgi:hypothetical protein